MHAVEAWAKDPGMEDAMNDEHRHLWQQLILHMEEGSLASRDVLDFGCSQGGFLRMLFAQKPFRHGTGADIACDALALARSHSGGLPLEFVPAAALQDMNAAFDIAFSHEVLYLLPDLAAHAALMRGILRPGGIYYAAIGCHTGNPQWPRWREIIAEYSSVKVQDYSLDDYARAFFDAGFTVSAKPFAFEGFVPLKRNNLYFPTLADSLHYHTFEKTVFRFING